MHANLRSVASHIFLELLEPDAPIIDGYWCRIWYGSFHLDSRMDNYRIVTGGYVVHLTKWIC